MKMKWTAAGCVACLLFGFCVLDVRGDEPIHPQSQVAAPGQFNSSDLLGGLGDVLTPFLSTDVADDEFGLFNVVTLRDSSHPRGDAHHRHSGHKPLSDEQRRELGKLIAGNFGRLLILYGELRVTPKQRTEMKSAFLKRRGNMKANIRTIRDRMESVDAATTADEDSATIKKAVSEVRSAVSDAVLEFLKAAQDARHVLSKDQRKKIEVTTTAILKSHEDFRAKTGLCPFAAMVRATHGLSRHGGRRSHHHRSLHTPKKRSKHTHSEKHQDVKRMVASNIGRLMVLYSELDLSDHQRSRIKESCRKHGKNLKAEFVSASGHGKLMVISMTSDQDEKAMRELADKIGDTVANSIMEVTQARQEIRKVLTSDQKKKIQETRTAIKKSVKEFRNKRKKMRKTRV